VLFVFILPSERLVTTTPGLRVAQQGAEPPF